MKSGIKLYFKLVNICSRWFCRRSNGNKYQNRRIMKVEFVRRVKIRKLLLFLPFFFLVAATISQYNRVTLKSWTLADYILNHESENSSDEFSFEMIRRWSKTRIDVCSPYNDDSDQGHVFCYKRNDFERPRLLCVLENAEIRMISPFHTLASLNLSVETNVTLKNGILRINCDPSVFNWIPKSFRNVALSSFVQDLGRPLRRMKCSTWVNHTVFWIYRWDYKNAYHFMEDVVTTFESLVVLNQDPNDVELVIYDGQPNNSALFTLWPKLMGKGVRMVRENPFPRNTCFRRSISNMFASRSHLTNHLMYARDTNSSSPILLGLRQWILDRLGIGTERRIPLKIKIVFISRKPMKGREITRIIQNEPEIHEAIRTTYPDAIFQIFQPEEFPTFKEQVQEILDADVLIGAHGAGLMYSLFMRPGSSLIEIFMDDRTSGNRHFHNVATWAGLNYDSIGHFTTNVEVEPLMEALNRTLNARGIHY